MIIASAYIVIYLLLVTAHHYLMAGGNYSEHNAIIFPRSQRG